jgi:hypothetical protein
MPQFQIKKVSLSIVLALVCVVFDAKADSGSSACMEVEFREPVTWSFSADWALSADRSLIFADYVSNTLSLYNESGRKVSLTEKVQGAVPGIFHVGAITTFSQERVYLLEDRVHSGSRRFVFLSEDFEFLGESPIPGRVDPDKNVLLTLYYWGALADEKTIIAYADIKKNDESYSSAVVQFSLETSDFQIIEEIDATNPARQLYLLRYPLIGGNHERISYMVANERSSRMEVLTKQSGIHKGGSRVLGTVATALPSRIDSLEGIDRVFQSLNQDGFIAAILVWHSRTFLVRHLLTGNPLSPRRWLVTEVDDVSGRELQSFILPTVAPHIMVVPGEDYWAVIEKGIVFQFNMQLIEKAWYVPSALFQAKGASLSSRKQVELCADGN